MINVGIIGLGRTGRDIAKELLLQDNINFVSAFCSPSNANVEKDLGKILELPATGIPISSSDNLKEVIFQTNTEVIVDFSSPEIALKNARILAKMGVNIVMGTTGFTESDIETLYKLSLKYENGIVYAPNITLGVNVLMTLTNIASSILNNYDFHITEVHHKHKKDSPSGTAKKIATEINNILNGGTNDTVSVSSVRAGGVVGVHKVSIVGEHDKVEISHESFSRKAFALGAIKAIEFIHGKNGFFEMKDVLNLNSIMESLSNQSSSNLNFLRKVEG